MRASNVKKLQREIEGGHWDARKSPFVRFDARGRLSDGQHRAAPSSPQAGPSSSTWSACRTPSASTRAPAARSPTNSRSTNTSRRPSATSPPSSRRRSAAALATDREQIAVFREHRDFHPRLHPQAAPGSPTRSAPSRRHEARLLAVARAQEIHLFEQPAPEVDELLEDLVNGGDTAPEGRSVARSRVRSGTPCRPPTSRRARDSRTSSSG